MYIFLLPSSVLIICCMFVNLSFFISCSSWFMMWVFMEIGLFLFISLATDKDKFQVCSLVKYFLVQMLGSFFVMAGVLFLVLGNWLYTYMVFLGLMIKLGVVPFHYWLIQVVDVMSWLSIYLLLSVQKIMPCYYMILWYSMIKDMFTSGLVSVLVILNGLVGTLMGLFQKGLKVLCGYSSINHFSWLLMGMLVDVWLVLGYFFVYMVSLYYFVSFVSEFGLVGLWEVSQMSVANTSLFSVIVMNLMGLPPFLGVLPKIMVMQSCIYLVECWLILLVSCVGMYFYLRMFIRFMLMDKGVSSWVTFKPLWGKLIMMQFMILPSLLLLF